MYKGKRILAVIPARGGSKGVPCKNIRIVAGKPLIAWTVEEARKSKYIDRTIISSDDNEILGVAQMLNCDAPFVRPAALAQDHVTGIEPVLHALQKINEKFDYIVLLQPTSPLRIVDDIDGCIKKCLSKNACACVTVCPVDKSPYWMYSFDGRGRLRPIIKQKDTVLLRQKLDDVYALNGAVYVARNDWFIKNKKFISDGTIAYLMPKARSVDIDTEFDLKVCNLLLLNRK